MKVFMVIPAGTCHVGTEEGGEAIVTDPYLDKIKIFTKRELAEGYLRDMKKFYDRSKLTEHETDI